MNPDTLFRLSGVFAMLGWLGLLLTPLWPARTRNHMPRLIFAVGIPGLIACIYSIVIVLHWSGHAGGFNTLSDVMLLFADRWLVLAGWVHYLAFDLFVGGWELADSRQRGVPHLLMVPILLLTFFFGPIGFLTYLALRSIFSKQTLATAV